MRTFIVLARKSPSIKFDTRYLPDAGRMDLVCRCISNALWVSNGVRENVVIKVVLEGGKKGPKVLTIDSNKIKSIRPDEKNIAMHIRKALRNRDISGMTVELKSFENLIKEYDNLYYLDKKGTDVRKTKFNKESAYILGDYIGLPGKTKKLMDRLGAKKLSLGNTMLFASHCIVLIHNELDRQRIF